MNSVLKLVKGDAAPAAELSAGEIVPDLAVHGLDVAAGGVAHLSHCPRCGELNGRSADSCWSCEADLHAAVPPSAALLRGAAALATGPAIASAGTSASADTTVPEYQRWQDLGLDLSAVSAAVDAVSASIPHGPALADRPLPVLTNSVRLGPAAAAYPEYTPAVARAQARPLSLGLIAASVGTAIVVLSIGLYLYIDRAEPDARPMPAALRAQPPEALPGGATPAAVEPGAGLSRADAALRAAELLTSPAPTLTSSEFATPAPRATGADRAKPARRANPRDTTRSPATVPASAGAAPQTAATARPSAPNVTPCTPTVLALGLCAGSSHQPPKE